MKAKAKLLILALAMMPAVFLKPQAAPAAAGDGKVQIAEISPEVEAAIDDALKYLARSQQRDGRFTAGSYPEANTAVALMAFMVKGHMPGKEPYGEQLNKGIDYLLLRAKEGGGFIGASMYEHGLATLALSESWGMCDRPEMRQTVKRCVDVILRAQDPNGGWRYQPQPCGADISVTVMQIVALAAAKEAGILVPDKSIERALVYVRQCQTQSGGFAYQPGGGPGFARTSAGLMSLIMTGERNTEAGKKQIARGLTYLKGLPETKFKEVEWFYYGHYYAIQAMYQAGENYYQEWYPSIRDGLMAKRRKDGSWDGDQGPVFSTSLSVLVLGVPYRFLPIYQR
jgi:prenyltransferase beta subunit